MASTADLMQQWEERQVLLHRSRGKDHTPFSSSSSVGQVYLHTQLYPEAHWEKNITQSKDTEDASSKSFVLTSVVTSYNVTVCYIAIVAVRGLWENQCYVFDSAMVTKKREK